MESKALRRMHRLEELADDLLARSKGAQERQAQLSAALVKSREEVDRLKAELERYRSERADTRKKVDSLLRRFEGLGLDREAAESKG